MAEYLRAVNPRGWTAEEVAQATGGLWRGEPPARIRGVAIDSRAVGEGFLFVALPGARADGHQFVEEAFSRGASAALVERILPSYEDWPLLVVEDSRLALGRLARWHRRRFSVPVVGITGSVGKTTTREMTAAVLGRKTAILAARENLNSDVGLPLVLLEMTGEEEAVVLEMAMRGPGQIDYLCRLAEPSVGVITTIGESHMEFFRSQEELADAKFELIRALPPSGHGVLPWDHPLVRKRAHQSRAPILWFGEGEGSQVRAREVEIRGREGVSFLLQTPRGRARVVLPVPGRHLVLNALAAAAVGHLFGLGPEEVAEALRNYRPQGHRTEILRLMGATILDDAYNSSPTSLRAALQVLRQVGEGTPLKALLADMLELGEGAPRHHREVGRELGFLSGLITLGPLAYHIGEGALEGGLSPESWVHAGTEEEALEALRAMLKPGDTWLIKGSRGWQLEKILARLRAGGEDSAGDLSR
ncbi:MAG: UDP-N-acetylmuramoyl-tripeptide--D-alanyl-D-alanine ligase [Clostridiales bacterium]|nr:UDP-N-acetylmuramoyl-tripeptide--D-alanyl-D-alanine ligase [Clostridiales bacterium]